MENIKAVYEQNKQNYKQANYHTKKRNYQKRNLILKDKLLNIKLKDIYLEVNDGILSQIYGVKNIKTLYIHKDIELSISDCFAISKYIKIFFIDANGNILAKYKRIQTV